MLIRIYCPNAACGARYRVDDGQVGRTAVCVQCHQQFSISRAAKKLPVAEPLADPASAVAVPKKIGRFEIRGRLGAGGFGVVYLARDPDAPEVRREIALKVFRRENALGVDALSRFKREAMTAAELHHPNIVPVYDFGKDGDVYYIVAEYIRGQTLEEVIETRAADFRRAAEIVLELAETLAFAHRASVVHRDVKPSNVLIDQEGHARLTDFGLARADNPEDLLAFLAGQEAAEAPVAEAAIDTLATAQATFLDRSSAKLTRFGAVLGTPAYMSPEQAAGRMDLIGPASDQYALGAVLYELLCGDVPFSGPPSLVVSMVKNQEPPRPRLANPAIPAGLEAICLKAMAKSPSQRYATCREMADDLRRWLTGKAVHARATALPGEQGKAAAPLWLWIAIGSGFTIGLLLLSSLLWLVTSGQKPNEAVAARPKIQPIMPQTIEVGRPLNVTVAVEDAQRWKGQLRYRLAANAPRGAKIGPQSGEFSWTPPLDHAAATEDVAVVVEGPGGQQDQTRFKIAVTRPLNLLDLIVPESDGVSGEWVLKAGELVSNKQFGARIEIPYQPPDEYVMTAVVQPLDEPNGLILGQQSEGRRFHVLINFQLSGSPPYTVLENVGNLSAFANPDAVRRPLLAKDRPSTVVCTVRRGRVRVECDGQIVIDWQGEASQLSLNDYWQTPNANALFLGAYDCRYAFHSVTLVPISGTGKNLPHTRPIVPLPQAVTFAEDAPSLPPGNEKLPEPPSVPSLPQGIGPAATLRGLTLDVGALAGPVAAHEALTYEVHVGNKGHAPEEQVAVTVTLPVGMVADPLRTSGPPVTTYAIDGSVIRFGAAPLLNAGASLTYRVRARTQHIGTFRLHAEVTSRAHPGPLTVETTTDVVQPGVPIPNLPQDPSVPPNVELPPTATPKGQLPPILKVPDGARPASTRDHRPQVDVLRVAMARSLGAANRPPISNKLPDRSFGRLPKSQQRLEMPDRRSTC